MLLTDTELRTIYYKKAVTMSTDDVDTYLARANALAVGIIGGEPSNPDNVIKTAVAMAFEVFAIGETAQVDDVTGNITEAAPAGSYTRNSKEADPFAVVSVMLQPAKRAMAAANATTSDRGVLFL